ncbi:MAG TPA: hypothetical protein VGR20_12840 [Acidimicrobiia bacterium]|nr:hypothetical protein [Acidimicrobiia bacterium]
MSKRSYRRLAVVTGAALAIGSMAPAMAARVTADTSGSASVSADAIDITDVTAGLPLPAVGTILPTALGVAGPLVANVTTAPGMLLADVSNIVGGALFLPGTVLGAVLAGSAPLVGATVETVGDVAGLGLPTVLGTAGFVTDTAFSTVGTLPQTVLALPTGLLNGGLTGLLGVSASGNVNVLAGLLGSM